MTSIIWTIVGMILAGAGAAFGTAFALVNVARYAGAKPSWSICIPVAIAALTGVILAGVFFGRIPLK